MNPRRRFNDNPLAGHALIAAMLTDLHLTSHLYDQDGHARAAPCAPPADPLLRTLFTEISHAKTTTWAEWIYRKQPKAHRTVCHQLKTA